MSAEGGPGTWSGMLELEAVSKRVERVEPVHALCFVSRQHGASSTVEVKAESQPDRSDRTESPRKA